MRPTVSLMVLTLCACTEDMTELWEVKEVRPMGMRIEPSGDATRTRPRLGEPFALRQYMATPGPSSSPTTARYDVGLSVCLGLSTPTSDLGCFAERIVSPTVLGVSDTELLLDGIAFDGGEANAAASYGLDQAQAAMVERLQVFGVLCVDGRAERDEKKSTKTAPPSQLYHCVDGQESTPAAAIPFTLSVPLDRGLPSDSNRNPSFACDPTAPSDSACVGGVSIVDELSVPGPIILAAAALTNQSGVHWAHAWDARTRPGPLPWDDCAADPEIFKLQEGSQDLLIRVRFDPGDREVYTYEANTNGQRVQRTEREELRVTTALTTKGGELAAFESVLPRDVSDDQADISVAYYPPALNVAPSDRAPPTGRLVRFYFTVRDRRGGIDFTTRELCLMPSSL